MAGKDDSPPGSTKPVSPGDPLDLATSVAGEEDPGASIDLTVPDGKAQQPLLRPSAGETVCPQCGGSGRLGASACPDCLGTGKVTVGIGGA